MVGDRNILLEFTYLMIPDRIRDRIEHNAARLQRNLRSTRQTAIVIVGRSNRCMKNNNKYK